MFPVPWNLHLSSCRWAVLCGRSLSTTWHSSRRCCRQCRETRLDLQRPNASRVFSAWWRRYLLLTTRCCHVGVAYLLSDITSNRCVLGVGGCSFLLHCGQSEQHHTLQYSPSTPVSVNTEPFRLTFMYKEQIWPLTQFYFHVLIVHLTPHSSSWVTVWTLSAGLLSSMLATGCRCHTPVRTPSRQTLLR